MTSSQSNGSEGAGAAVATAGNGRAPDPFAWACQDSAALKVLDGATFVLDAPDDVPAVWGTGDQVAWASGEPCFLVGPPGVGKTTLAQQLALTRHGAFDTLEFLGMPVALDPRPVLYLACDRPQQAARSMRRMVTEVHRPALEYFIVWKGPLHFDLASDPEGLRDLALGLGAGTVVVDSLKDVALDLTSDETGSRANLALQHTVSAGVEVLVLHHQRKGSADNRKPRTLDDVYGSRWLTAGAGSVLLLWGEAGDPIVEMRHLKQPAAEIGPLSVTHDHERGTSQVYKPVSIPALVRAATNGGLTAGDAAAQLYGVQAPDRNQTEKARRQLERQVKAGLATKVGGEQVGQPVRYRPVDPRRVA